MYRFFTPPDRSQFPSFALSESDSRHASQVLRLQPGDPVTLLDGVGGVIDAHIQSVAHRETWVTVSYEARLRLIKPPSRDRTTSQRYLPAGAVIELAGFRLG